MDNSIYLIVGLLLLVLVGWIVSRAVRSSGSAPVVPPESAPAEKPPAVKSAARTETPKPSETQGKVTADVPGPKTERSGSEALIGPPSPPSSTRKQTAPEQPASRPSFTPKPGMDVQRVRSGLARSRDDGGFFGKLKSLLTGRAEIPASISTEIEEVLLSSDVGAATAREMIERIQKDLARNQASDSAAVWSALRAEARRLLSVDGKAGALKFSTKPTVILFVGVNGAGKTTTIGKLAAKLRAEGKTCVLAAGDTFRAAAVQQLTVWGQRVGCEVIRGKDGADPGSVVFDAIKRAEEIGADVVLADTAGRLHTKANLMAEMEKIARTAAKALPGAPHEVMLVLDATNGQNALAQAREFKESLELGGIVLTKLDGTAKGGVILGIADALKVPVRYVGLGERPDDLHEFVVDEFVEALLGKE